MKQAKCLKAIALAIIALCAGPDHARSTSSQVPAAPANVALKIPPGQKFILRLETDLHTRTARKGDRVEFRTAADVVVDNQVIIPNRSLVRATVIKAKRAGRLFGRAQIRLRFDDIRLGDGTALPLSATIIRVGFDPVGEIFGVANVASLDAALSGVIYRLRMRYSLGYYPSSQAQGGAFHSIKVRLVERLGKPGVDYFMHARRGYYSTGDSTKPRVKP